MLIRLVSIVRKTIISKFTEEEKEFNTDKKIDAQYSPNKQLYLEFIYAAEKNGKYYHSGFDDSQKVWLIDHRQKHAATMNYRSYAIW